MFLIVNQLHFIKCNLAQREMKKINIQMQTFGTLWSSTISVSVSSFHNTNFYANSMYLVKLIWKKMTHFWTVVSVRAACLVSHFTWQSKRNLKTKPRQFNVVASNSHLGDGKKKLNTTLYMSLIEVRIHLAIQGK